MRLKIILFAITILIVSVRASSQGYASIFGDTSSIWYQHMEIPDGELSITISTIKDTTINFMEYKQINVEGNTDYYLREDTLTGEIWILDDEYSLEYQLMDLDLGIGDTFLTTHNLPAIVTDIHYEEGRKIVELDYLLRNWCNEDSLTFIEGIGPDAGFLYQLELFFFNGGTNNFLLCAFKDDEKVFSSEFATESCGIIHNCVGFDNHSSQMASFYPNPVEDIFIIDLNKPGSGILSIYSNIGILKKQIPIDIEQSCEIDISNLKKGFYFIQFVSSYEILNLGCIFKK